MNSYTFYITHYSSLHFSISTAQFAGGWHVFDSDQFSEDFWDFEEHDGITIWTFMPDRVVKSWIECTLTFDKQGNLQSREFWFYRANMTRTIAWPGELLDLLPDLCASADISSLIKSVFGYICAECIIKDYEDVEVEPDLCDLMVDREDGWFATVGVIPVL